MQGPAQSRVMDQRDSRVSRRSARVATRRSLRLRPVARSGRTRETAKPETTASASFATYLIELREESPARVTVRADGSVTIPRSIRNALLLDPGDRLVVGFEGGVVLMRPVETIVLGDEASEPAGMPAGVIAEFLKKRRRR
jgi:AbrB family looped-hinge helix DNA binding protein